MEQDRATRIYIALTKMISLTDDLSVMSTLPESYLKRIEELTKSKEYSELKEWAKYR